MTREARRRVLGRKSGGGGNVEPDGAVGGGRAGAVEDEGSGGSAGRAV